jgi:hypothetical protein
LIEVKFDGLIVIFVFFYPVFLLLLLDSRAHSSRFYTHFLLGRRFLFLFAFLFRTPARFLLFPHSNSSTNSPHVGRSNRSDGRLGTSLPSSVDLVRPVQSSFDQSWVGEY